MKTVEQAVSDLVRAGGAFQHAPEAVPMVVGLMRASGRGKWFWWEAGGNTEFDGHVMECDRAEVLYGGKAVLFTSGERLVGYLTTFDEAIDDADGIATARAKLASWRAEYDHDEALRGFIEQEARRRG